jgi:hypothetical protein
MPHLYYTPNNRSNIDGVLNKFKRKITNEEEDLPHASCLVPDEILSLASERPFILKLRKGGNLHRFKVKMVYVVTEL